MFGKKLILFLIGLNAWLQLPTWGLNHYKAAHLKAYLKIIKELKLAKKEAIPLAAFHTEVHTGQHRHKV